MEWRIFAVVDEIPPQPEQVGHGHGILHLVGMAHAVEGQLLQQMVGDVVQSARGEDAGLGDGEVVEMVGARRPLRQQHAAGGIGLGRIILEIEVFVDQPPAVGKPQVGIPVPAKVAAQPFDARVLARHGFVFMFQSLVETNQIGFVIGSKRTHQRKKEEEKKRCFHLKRY